MSDELRRLGAWLSVHGAPPDIVADLQAVERDMAALREERDEIQRAFDYSIEHNAEVTNQLRAQLAEKDEALLDEQTAVELQRLMAKAAHEERDTLRVQLDEARGMRGADAGERWYLKNLQAANQDYAKQITTLRAQLAEARSGRGRAGWRE
jgi:hypothetical protein